MHVIRYWSLIAIMVGILFNFGHRVAANPILLANDQAEVTVGDDARIQSITLRNPTDGIGLHSYFQRFLYRIGDAGGEKPLSALEPRETIKIDRDGNGTFEFVRFKFEDADGRLRIFNDFEILETNNPDKASFSNTIAAVNITPVGAGDAPMPLDIHLFLHTNADLDINLSLESPADYDTVFLANPNRFLQTSPRGAVSSSAVTTGPLPDGYRITIDPRVFFPPPDFDPLWIDPLGDELNDGNPTTLEPIPPTDELPTTIFSSKGMQWAWQWNLTLPDGLHGVPSQFIRIQNAVSDIAVPEPAAFALLALGLAGLGLYRRRRRRTA